MMGIDIAGIGAVADLASTIVNKIWPDKSEQEKAQIAMAVQVVQGQLDINKAEAANPNMFVAGWRPAVGWVCASAMAFQYLVRPLLIGFGITTSMPALDDTLWGLLFGMLGIGGLRTFEKVQGVSK